MIHIHQPAKWMRLVVGTVLTALVLWTCNIPAFAAGGLEMSTDYPGIVVKAGDSVNFSISFSNDTGAPLFADLSVESIPDGWSGYFKGGGNQISRIAVKPGSASTTATFSLTIPADAAEGDYSVVLKAVSDAGQSDTLELQLNVGQVETSEGKFTAQYPELQGAASATFNFSTTLANNGLEEQSYSLTAQPPEGWQVGFKPSGASSQVASLSVDAGGSTSITVTVTPPASVKAGTYKIPCAAVSARETLATELTVIITGSYSLDVSTPSGRLSAEAYAERETPITLSITNTGSSDLQNVNLTSAAPTNWNVRFDTSTIDVLEVGATKEVTAYITPSSDAMTGDYITVITASTSETSDKAEFRVSVKTRTAWGVVGVVLILAMGAGLAAIFRKYGRR